MNPVFKPGLYAVTAQRYPDRGRLLREVRAALEGGAAMIQFRDKSDDTAWRRETVAGLKMLCDEFQAPLIINDDLELACKVGAAGLHLGRHDAALATARATLGPLALIGISCYDDLARAEEAATQGADYLAFGSVFPSETKPEAVQCPLPILEQARALGLPVVAIGGITPDNGRRAVDAGADGLAVIGAVFDARDVKSAAQAFSAIWASQRSPD